MTTKSPLPEAVAEGLRQLLRRGLPVTAGEPPPSLLELRGVLGRSADPSDLASRAEALDGLLRSLLARFPDPRYAEAARILFGLGEGAGLKLMARRTLAAERAAHEAHHFRKRVEPRLIEQLAGELASDADRFRNTRLIAPRLAASPGRQPIPADPFAWEVAEREESLTRVWAAIYALRAELLRAERLISLDKAAEAMPVLEAAAWRWGRAQDLALTYTEAFEGAIRADDLVALAGWCPEPPPEEAVRLRTAAAAAVDFASFRSALTGLDLHEVWVKRFLTGPASDPIRESTVL